MRRLIIFVGIIALTLVIFAALLAWTQRFPHFEKLVDCNSPFLTFSLNCPPGDSFNFVLAIQDVTNLTGLKYPDFAGRVEIKNSQNEIVSTNIFTKKVSLPFWLNEGNHIAGFNLIFPNNSSPFISKVLKPKRNYTVNVAFSIQPPRDTELWLIWRQSRIDAFK